MPIPRIPKSPLIRRSEAGLGVLRGATEIVLADAEQSTPVAQEATSTFRALGYRQSVESAARGGTTNRKGIRVRNGAMRALGRSFRGTPFLMNHDWDDIRARGGTVTDAWAEEISGNTEIAIFYDVNATVPWAIEGLKNGTIDRFSFGIGRAGGEIFCTLHNAPVWEGDCWCWPGETLDGQVAEWEFQDPEGLELSSVNVPAVRGTSIVADAGGDRTEAEYVAELAALCGREHRPLGRVVVPVGGAPKGAFAAPPPASTMTTQHVRSTLMERAVICQMLGLPATATDAEITARANALKTDAAQASVLQTQLAEVSAREAERAAAEDAAHVESEIARLTSTRIVSDVVVTSIRATAKSGRAAFNQALGFVEQSAPPKPAGIGAAPTSRAQLQSDTKPMPEVGAEVVELDAYELNKTNPHLAPLMKRCGLSVDNVRKHGSATFNIVPKLGELIEATTARGE